MDASTKLGAIHTAQATFAKLTLITDGQTFDTAAEEWEQSFEQRVLQELANSFNQWQIQGLQQNDSPGSRANFAEYSMQELRALNAVLL